MIGPIAASPATGTVEPGLALGVELLPLTVAVLALLAALLLSRRSRVGNDREEPSRYQTHRDELLATLGHELRSPLRALLALLETARPGEGAGRTEELRALAAHALRIAEDSLDFALLERGAVHLRTTPVDLEQVLADVLSVIRPLRRADVALEVDLAPGLPLHRLGDGARLAQVLVNLLANAIAHTPHGTVRLALAPADPPDARTPGVAFVVRDSGTGMTPAERLRAFLPFEQGEAPRGRAGIGLAVVARIVDAMGGDVKLESSPGLGSCFTVTVPMPLAGGADATVQPVESPPDLEDRVVGLCCRRPADRRSLLAQLRHWGAAPLAFPAPEALVDHLRAGRPLDALVLVHDESPQALEDLLATRARQGLAVVRSAPDAPETRLPSVLRRALLRTPSTGEPDLDGLAVLVVDDHPVVRRVLHGLLSRYGCHVTTAEDGESAVEIARDPEECFDWVLLDRRMPGLDGLATAALLREAAGTRAARIALLVNDAGDDPGSPELFDQVLVRPQHPEALGDLLSLTLSRGGHRRSREPLPAADDQLAALRDETLREDLAALRAAVATRDPVAVRDHLHRMEGALRLCPDGDLQAALDTLVEAIAAGRPEDAAQAFAERLGVTAA